MGDDGDEAMTEIGGGSIAGLEVGDRFELRTSKICFWQLTITETRLDTAVGNLVVMTPTGSGVVATFRASGMLLREPNSGTGAHPSHAPAMSGIPAPI